MAFSKQFPKTTDKSTYPKWVEVNLSDAEESEQEAKARVRNIQLFKDSIEDAKNIIHEMTPKNQVLYCKK